MSKIFSGSATKEADAIIDKIGVVSYKHTKFVMGSGLMTFSRKGKVEREHLEEYLKVKYNIDADFSTGVSAFFGKGNSYSKDGKELSFEDVLSMVS